ncbi:MAG: glycine zipper 2TM domain-containing protein [Burkholderiales bacterium]|nr:glycine zipper 2TM domain-containing protein [Burkholderiales bacterium]
MITKSSVLLLAGVLGLASALGGCASTRSADVYSPSEALNEARVRSGVIESVRPVRIQSDSEIGKLVGAIVGGIGGSDIGQGKGSAVGAVLGATVGSAVGNAVGKEVNTKPGLEIVLTLDSGEVISVVQEADVNLVAGQRVRVITRGRVSRVVPAEPTPHG